ncbi:MAG: glycosyltransferase family 10 domain-containing protein [Roseovarius sp.]
MPLDRLLWPLGRPDRLAGEGATIADLAPTDHLVGFAQSYYLAWPGLGTRARVSIIMAEPAAIHGAYQARVARAARRYHRILSYNEDLLARVPNGIFFPYGSTWVRDWQSRDMTKSAMCSLIASKKRSQAGHALRHRLVERVRAEALSVDVMGRGYKPFDTKAEGLAPYRYSLIIENVQERNYFTEKLVDAVLCRTVRPSPISAISWTISVGKRNRGPPVNVESDYAAPCRGKRAPSRRVHRRLPPPATAVGRTARPAR